MLIYKQLGANAQNEFAKTWGVGYALNNASEWRDVAITAAKAALLIVILDALRLTKNASWFEEHGACALSRLSHPALLHLSFMLMDTGPSFVAASHFRAHAHAVDFVSMQAVLFNGAARGWWAQTHTLVRLQARLTED
jgi:hypothetical protein